MIDVHYILIKLGGGNPKELSDADLKFISNLFIPFCFVELDF